MREVLGIMQQVIGWIFWLLEQAWLLGLSVAALVAGAWPEGQPWKQVGFLILIALLGYGVFLLSRKMLKGMHHIFNALACVLVALLAIVPTVVITFLALAGGFWIIKSF